MTPSNALRRSLVTFTIAMVCVALPASAQRVAPGTPATAPAPTGGDPTLDTTGLPFYVSLMPKPEPEPWRFPDGETRKRRFVSETFGANTYTGAAVAAAYSFWLNNPREWDQDFPGYMQRVGNNVAGAWIRGAAVHGLAAAFNEDIGYSRSQAAGARNRLLYAVGRTVLAKDGNGHMRLSYSRAMGGVGTAFLSRTWAPESWRPWDNAMKNYAYWLLTEAGFNIGKEFFPSIVRSFKIKKQKKLQQP